MAAVRGPLPEKLNPPVTVAGHFFKKREKWRTRPRMVVVGNMPNAKLVEENAFTPFVRP